MKEVFICAAIRTPLGSFGGALSAVPATKLGAAAIQGALQKAGIAPELIQEVFMGNVCSANLGQAPARQAALYAGLSNTTVCTTINKVCSSAAKAIMFGAQSIMLGINDLVVAGGMENMSMVPYYIPKARFGYKYGNAELIDGLDKDGLKDVYQQASMGTFADITAKKYEISREAQDAYAIRSYKNAERATQSGIFADEITPVEVPQPKGNTVIVKEDEEYKNVKFDKIPSLKPGLYKRWNSYRRKCLYY
jgi:acetyl-CoA C-acetyltransferase